MQRSTNPIPLDSIVFGYGPMVPLAAAAIGAWVLPQPWPAHAIGLAIIWGGLILAFVAGVRRGYGFGNAEASTLREIVTMIVYFVPAGLAVVCGSMGFWLAALVLLTIGYGLVIVLDRYGAARHDIPSHFARLRPTQMAIAVVALLAMIARILVH
jgi:hypothetical protein